ncbi:MAG: TonB-dependent receptor, partial [Gammaproteobacteria bacterium]|nr:TonB-dependent receptor [Gammaproteobacteria bacterium]
GDNTDVPYVANIAGFSQNDRTNASIKLDYETDFGTFTAVGAYSITEDFYGADSYPYFFDPGLFDTFFPGATPPGLGAQTQVTNRRSEIATLDVRFQSSDDNRFRWLAGAFYATFDIVNRSSTGADTANRLDGIGPFPFGSPNQTLGFLADEQDNEAYAFYINTEFDVSDKLTVTASVRYDKETKNQTDVAFPGPANAADPKGIPTWWFEGWRSREESFSEVQPKFTVRYELAEEATVYASWGRGFKTGGFNPFGAGALIRSFNPTSTVGDLFDKEVADSFEAGAKIRLLDGRLSINLAGFYTETENAQLLEFFPAATLQAVSIAEGVEMSGGEIDFTLVSAAIEGLTVYGGVGILNTEVTEFASNPALVGNERPSTSPYTANFGGTYTRELPILGGAEGFGRLDWTFQGETEWDWPNTPNAARSAIDLVNARLGMRKDNWEVAFVGKNLTNTIYNAEHIVLIPAAGIGALYRAQPRTYGGEVIVRF